MTPALNKFPKSHNRYRKAYVIEVHNSQIRSNHRSFKPRPKKVIAEIPTRVHRNIEKIVKDMAINELSDEGSSGSISALDRALVPGLSREGSKASVASDDSEGSDSSCSASTETVATNLDASNHCQAQTAYPEKQRRITFNDKARVRKIPHHSTFTEEQIGEIWISKEEYKALRKDCAQRIRFLDKVKLKHPNEAPFCTRGLISHTSAARAKKNAYRDVMYDALAQALEKEMEEGLDEALAEICRICSAPSVKTAHSQGLKDEREAKRIHGDIRVRQIKAPMELVKI